MSIIIRVASTEYSASNLQQCLAHFETMKARDETGGEELVSLYPGKVFAARTRHVEGDLLDDVGMQEQFALSKVRRWHFRNRYTLTTMVCERGLRHRGFSYKLNCSGLSPVGGDPASASEFFAQSSDCQARRDM